MAGPRVPNEIESRDRLAARLATDIASQSCPKPNKLKPKQKSRQQKPKYRALLSLHIHTHIGSYMVISRSSLCSRPDSNLFVRGCTMLLSESVPVFVPAEKGRTGSWGPFRLYRGYRLPDNPSKFSSGGPCSYSTLWGLSQPSLWGFLITLFTLSSSQKPLIRLHLPGR